MKLNVCERLGAGLKTNRRARAARVTDNLQGRQRFAVRVFLLVRFTVAMNSEHKVFGQRVDNGNTDTMQAA